MQYGQTQPLGLEVIDSAKLCLDWYPYLVAAHTCSSVKFFVVIFEEGGIDSLVARVREPFCPDRHADAMDGRNVFAMRKNGVALGRNAQSHKFRGEVGEAGHLYAGEIVKVSIVVHVVADAKRPPPLQTPPRRQNLPRDVAEMGMEALPQSRNVLVSAERILSAEA